MEEEIIEDYKAAYELLRDEYSDAQDRIIILENDVASLNSELEDSKLDRLHFNESPLGWAVMNGPIREVAFLAKDKGWDREKIEQVERLLEES